MANGRVLITLPISLTLHLVGACNALPRDLLLELFAFDGVRRQYSSLNGHL